MTANITPDRPPITNDDEEPEDEQERRPQHGPAAEIVASQAKTWIAARDRDRHARRREEGHRHLRQPDGEHVVHPDAEAEEAGRHRREHDQRVARHIGRREKTGTIDETIPTAGRKMM